MKLIDIFALGFLLLALWGVKPAPRAQCFPEPLEKPVTDSLRGLFALMVVLHHLSYYAYEGLLFRWFAYVGYLAVAVFFFLSGYGLMRQLEGSGTPYIKRIFAKKLPKLVLVYGFFTVIYSLAWLALGYRFTWRYVLYSLVSGSPIVLNSWYILTLVLLYVCFGAVFGLCGKHRTLGLWLMAAVQAAYVLLMHHFGYAYHLVHQLLRLHPGAFRRALQGTAPPSAVPPLVSVGSGLGPGLRWGILAGLAHH